MKTEQSIAAFVEIMAAQGFDRGYVEDMVEEHHGAGEMDARDVERVAELALSPLYEKPFGALTRYIIREWCAAVGIDVPADMKGGE